MISFIKRRLSFAEPAAPAIVPNVRSYFREIFSTIKGGAKRMEIKIINDEETATAFIHGDIDHHTAKDIREQIDGYVQERRPRLLNLDFSSVQFMDSSGIGLIMGRHRLMQLVKGSVKVVNIPEHLKRLIKISGLLSLGVIAEGEV